MKRKSEKRKEIEKSQREKSTGSERKANRAKSMIKYGEFIVINDARELSLPAASINTVNARQMDVRYSRIVPDHPRLRLFSHPRSLLRLVQYSTIFKLQKYIVENFNFIKILFKNTNFYSERRFLFRGKFFILYKIVFLYILL